ncbi:hypothetical protein ACFPM1_07830 [Halorubrum rubrum]|uniref:MarR family transcriptional regulator n=1 Tax=Halorubrum rubrum TaxID=1126240 RepID=A0ABD5R195_9EURY|nr:hypothetical protein [Halorubrum rubrum]
MTAYDAIVRLVAENPALDEDEIGDLANDELDVDDDHARELLATALERGDVVQAGGHYWVMRKGEYAFHEYDHPIS